MSERKSKWVVLFSTTLIVLGAIICCTEDDWRPIAYFGILFVSFAVYSLWVQPMIESTFWGFLLERQNYGFDERFLRFLMNILGFIASILFVLSVKIVIDLILDFIGSE